MESKRREDMSDMSQADKIWLARMAVDKAWSFEQLKYGDYLYGKEDMADEVWSFVEELRKIGSDAFNDKYPR